VRTCASVQRKTSTTSYRLRCVKQHNTQLSHFVRLRSELQKIKSLEVDYEHVHQCPQLATPIYVYFLFTLTGYGHYAHIVIFSEWLVKVYQQVTYIQQHLLQLLWLPELEPSNPPEPY